MKKPFIIKEKTEKEKTEELVLKSRISLDFPIAKGKSVIILRGTDEEISSNGIIIPESTTDQRMRGVIVSVGSQVCDEFIDHNGVTRILMPKDKVLFNAYANLNIIHKGISYVVISELDVYAVLPENVVVGTERHKSRKNVKVNWES